MAEEQLNGPQVAGLLVNLGDLPSPHRMRAICARLQTNRCDPVADDPRILASGDMQALMEAAWPEVLRADHKLIFHPFLNGSSRPLGNLETNRFLRLALQHRCTFFDLAGRHDVDDLHLDQIATAQFAVNCHVEERKVAMVFC